MNLTSRFPKHPKGDYRKGPDAIWRIGAFLRDKTMGNSNIRSERIVLGCGSSWNTSFNSPSLDFSKLGNVPLGKHSVNPV